MSIQSARSYRAVVALLSQSRCTPTLLPSPPVAALHAPAKTFHLPPTPSHCNCTLSRVPLRRLHTHRPTPPLSQNDRAATSDTVEAAQSHPRTSESEESNDPPSDTTVDASQHVTSSSSSSSEFPSSPSSLPHRIPAESLPSDERPSAPLPPPYPPHDLDASIRRQLFLHRARMRGKAMVERMQRMRARVWRMGDGQPAHSTADHHSSSHLPDAIKRVFHRRLTSRLELALGRRMSRAVVQRWRPVMARLFSLGGSSTGNQVKLYSSGTEAWSDMWKAIRGAKRSIHMESYIVEADGVGQKTMRLLAEAAQRGVEVHFCYDSWGSSNLLHQRKELDELAAAGAQVIHFNPIWHLFVREAWRGSLWFRNHRKILIVDSEVGFCGGMNISVDYFGKQEEPNSVEATESSFVDAALDTPSSAVDSLPPIPPAVALSDADEYVGGTGKFRDTHLQVRGPAVAHLERVSLDTFHEAFVGVGGVQEGVPHAQKTRARLLASRQKAASAITGVGARKRTRWYPARSPALAAVTQAQQAAAATESITPSTVNDSAVAASCRVPESHFAAVAAHHQEVSPSNEINSDLFVQVLPSNVWRNMRLIQRAMLLTVQSARSSIRITNPYFFPPPRLFRALQQASARGVHVSILMAGEGLTDVPVTRWASQHIYNQLLRSGVRIYECQSAVLHAKTVTIDGIYSSIGSFNWDRSEREREQGNVHRCNVYRINDLSARRNLEVNLTCLDPDLARTLEDHFETDLKGSREITVRSLKKRNGWQRLLHRVAYWVMRYL